MYEIYFQVSERYVTGRWGTIDHRRGADTTAAKHAKRIYQTGSSLPPLESDKIKNKNGPCIKRHVLVIHHTTATKKKVHFISTKYRVLHSRVQLGQVFTLYTSPRLEFGPVRVASPYAQETHQCHINTSTFPPSTLTTTQHSRS